MKNKKQDGKIKPSSKKSSSGKINSSSKNSSSKNSSSKKSSFGTIKIKCTAAELIDIDKLNILQGDLKNMTEENCQKLKKSIIEKGFSFPIFIWKNKKKNWILDGTHRYKELIKMREDGFEIPPIPIAVVEAKNLKDAKEKLLAVSSQFADITPEGLFEFGKDLDLSSILENIKLPDFDIDSFKINFLNFESSFAKINEEEIDENLNTDHECPSCGYEW